MVSDSVGAIKTLRLRNHTYYGIVKNTYEDQRYNFHRAMDIVKGFFFFFLQTDKMANSLLLKQNRYKKKNLIILYTS